MNGAWILLVFVAVFTALFLYLLDKPRLGELLREHIPDRPRGRHIHHLVFGIFLLLLVGYGWLAEIGTGSPSSSLLVGRLMCLLYGAGAALVLDEFALWLNLQDVYWAQQ